jgi:hypothetical protein
MLAVARTVARAGAFRGFGGVFTEPPTVGVIDERMFVRGGTECWLLSADAFGATFHRVRPEEFERARRRSPLPNGVSVHGTTLTVRGSTITLPDVFDRPSSVCATRTTLSLTSSRTHAILLIALPVA